MHTKLDKYWDPDELYWEHLEVNPRRNNKEIEFNLALVIATVLDPRRKGDYLDFFYEKVSKNVNQILANVNSVLQCMRKYFKEYEQIVRTSINVGSSEGSSTNVGSPIVGKRKLEQEFAQHKSRRRLTRV
uniref:hAT-like transposase RNase-H fold domain-containing protein n=1 Tax=Arundo donax TaxID=35708 RepID=A0A0A9FDH0_ARUDO